MGLDIIVFSSVTDSIYLLSVKPDICLYLEGSCEVLFSLYCCSSSLLHFIDQHMSRLVWPVCVCCSTNKQALHDYGDRSRPIHVHTLRHMSKHSHKHTLTVNRWEHKLREDEKILGVRRSKAETHTLQHTQMQPSMLHSMFLSLVVWERPGQPWDL